MAADRSVSIVKETRGGEQRVILRPDDLGWFTERGFDVLVEEGAGARAGHPDGDYEAAGAWIVSRDAAWRDSDVVLKYKAPGPEEYGYFREDLTVGAYMHAEGNPELTKAMRDSGMTAIAYEFHRTDSGVFPLHISDNETSGQMAVLYGAYHLQSHLGGRGVFMPRLPGADSARVLVIGYGNAGGAAARLAAAMGAEVTVLGTRREGLRRFEASVGGNVRCRVNSDAVLREEVPRADLVVGAILISTFDTPAMIDEELLGRMKPGSMIVDVTCGYGPGYLPTFDRETTHADPVYQKNGVLHCKIDAMPAAYPVSATQATSRNVAPYLSDLAERVYRDGVGALAADDGAIVSGGRLVHPELTRNIRMHPGSPSDLAAAE